MKKCQDKFILKYFDLLIKIILFFSITSISFANENKIGSITEINGTIVAINDELEERDLLIHDTIFLKEEIFATEGELKALSEILMEHTSNYDMDAIIFTVNMIKLFKIFFNNWILRMV